MIYIKTAFDLQKQFFIIKTMIRAFEYNVTYRQNCEFSQSRHFWQSEMQLHICVKDCFLPGDFDF